MTPTTNNQAIRYSIKPRESYARLVGKRLMGPATSAIIDSAEMWNLAYLSHDYDKTLCHLDPFFTTNVRRTVQTRLDGQGLDLLGDVPPKYLVQGLLRLPAPQFLHLIKKSPILKELPLYLAYGEDWLQTIEQRSWLCQPDTGPVSDMSECPQAMELLDKIRRKK